MSSSSSSTQADTSQTSINKDNRIAAAENSVNLADSSGNAISVTTIDAGAVGRSFDFAERVTDKAADLAAASVGAVQAQSKSSLQAVKEAYQDESDHLAKAWEQSRAGEQKIMVVAALAVVGVVALKGLR